MGRSNRRSTALRPLLMASATAALLCAIAPASAQTVGADTTVGTQVTPGPNRFTITGGTIEGNNLFHSFRDFSPQTWSAIFDLTDISYAGSTNAVSTVFSRVTGSSVSDVNGSLQVIGGSNPDFFLLNPNGIIFGPNAQLNIGGSFVGSTAESIRFADGIEFSASSTAAVPLLTMSVPSGLQMGASSGGIQVNDTGYTALSALPLRIDSSSGLRVSPGKTFALVGSDITFTGGLVAAPAGRIELGSVQEGLVGLDPSQWALDYQNVQGFRNISLTSQSLLDASNFAFGPTGRPNVFGSQGGTIQLQGSRISAYDGSAALIQNFGNQSQGSLQVSASERIELVGKDVSNQVRSGFSTVNYGAESGGSIGMFTQQLNLTGGAAVETATFGSGNGGHISVTARDAIQINRDATGSAGGIRTYSYSSGTAGSVDVFTGRLTSTSGGISSQANGSGNGGTVRMTAAQIRMMDGSSIASTALGSGNGGDVLVEADTIEMSGVDANFSPTSITAGTINTGNAGSLTVNTRRLLVSEGGRIDSSTVASGNAGSVTVTASELVEVSGTVPGSINPSLIISSANILDPALRATLAERGVFIPEVPSGASGNVTITTPTLTVSRGAQATVRNDGPGNAGTLTVAADAIYLRDRASLTASTQEGSGGNIFLNARDVLLMRNGSRISAEARGVGDGGNITIMSPAIVAFENSDIIANAVRGDGGNIDIDTQLLLGTQFRDKLTPESDITASSEFGLSGTVSVEGFKEDPNSGLVELPADVVDGSDQIASSCASSAGNRFIASGRGGLPPSPERSASDRPWNDLRDLSAFRNQPLEQSAEAATQAQNSSVTEATAWTLDEHGQVTLMATADSTEPAVHSTATCTSQLTGQEYRQKYGLLALSS